ncbi:hypothetical protein Y032_0159g3314 [Ancylostoma ceylanicum]|nr:hypothetical protein Y032_0159g3314 [Ancylostoma ceylanicum]
MSESVADTRDAFKYITNIIDDAVSSAKNMLNTLEREATRKSAATANEVIIHGEAVTPPNPVGQSYLHEQESLPLLGTRISCDMYRSLDRRRVMITQVYEAQEEINDETAKRLERSAQSLTRRCVVGSDDLVRV